MTLDGPRGTWVLLGYTFLDYTNTDEELLEDVEESHREEITQKIPAATTAATTTTTGKSSRNMLDKAKERLTAAIYHTIITK